MIKTRRAKPTISAELKLEAFEPVVNQQRAAQEVALALELNPDPLGKWIRLYKRELLAIKPVEHAITH